MNLEYLNWNRMFSSSPACCLTGVVGTWKWKQNRLWIPWFVRNQLIGWAISIMFIYGYDHFQVYIDVYCISMLASKNGCLRVPAYGPWCLFHLAHQVWDLWGSMFQAIINHPIPPNPRKLPWLFVEISQSLWVFWIPQVQDAGAWHALCESSAWKSLRTNKRNSQGT